MHSIQILWITIHKLTLTYWLVEFIEVTVQYASTRSMESPPLWVGIKKLSAASWMPEPVGFVQSRQSAVPQNVLCVRARLFIIPFLSACNTWTNETTLNSKRFLHALNSIINNIYFLFSTVRSDYKQFTETIYTFVILRDSDLKEYTQYTILILGKD